MYYTNEEMIKIHNELLTTPIERREGVLVRYGVFKEEFPDIEFEDDEKPTPQPSGNNGEGTDSSMGCCGLLFWFIAIIFVLYVIEKLFL